MENPRRQRKYKTHPISIERMMEFVCELGDPPRSEKSEDQVSLAVNRLTQTMKELEELLRKDRLRDEVSPARCHVFYELAGLLYAAHVAVDYGLDTLAFDIWEEEEEEKMFRLAADGFDD